MNQVTNPVGRWCSAAHAFRSPLHVRNRRSGLRGRTDLPGMGFTVPLDALSGWKLFINRSILRQVLECGDEACAVAALELKRTLSSGSEASWSAAVLCRFWNRLADPKRQRTGAVQDLAMFSRFPDSHVRRAVSNFQPLAV